VRNKYYRESEIDNTRDFHNYERKFTFLWTEKHETRRILTKNHEAALKAVFVLIYIYIYIYQSDKSSANTVQHEAKIRVQYYEIIVDAPRHSN
jgi:uncharacterized membrane protein YozB (DUF420 family)